MAQKPEPGKPILVEIGGQLYELKYPLGILKRLDVEGKVNVLKGDGMEGAFTTPAKLAMLLYYGLLTKQPDLTLEWVEENVEAPILLRLVPLIAYATTGRWPNIPGLDEELSPNGATESRPITGSPSGLSVATISASQSANSGE